MPGDIDEIITTRCPVLLPHWLSMIRNTALSLAHIDPMARKYS